MIQEDNNQIRAEVAKGLKTESERFREEAEAAEREWRQGSINTMQELEMNWSQLGHSFTWIDLEPTYTPVSDWSGIFSDDCDSNGCSMYAFPGPLKPCDRIIRFNLLGGGQIRSTEHFRSSPPSWRIDSPVYLAKIDLKITAHNTDGSVVIVSGVKYEGFHREINAQAVVLRSRKHQAIADRVAATFRLIDNNADHFFALMDGATGCAICGRPLKDQISKLIGVGPECAHRYRVPHSREAAERRLALRQKLLQQSI
jgi:hypothetical protein